MMPNSNNPQTKTRIAAVLALAAALLVSAASPAAPPAKPQQDTPTITPNYKDADLSQIIQAVAEVTGKNFIIDPRVNAKVTMLSATPMSPAAFYEAFLSVLQVYGYVAVPAGKVIKIVPNTDARQLPANDLPASVSSSSDEIVTQIITVKNISAAQLVPILRPFVPQYGQLTAYPSGNMLIISDRASNVSRIVRIVERMDSSEDEPIEVIALHNASASDVVRVVNSINQGGQGAEGAGSAVKIVADDRTNSILLTGEKSQRLKLKALIVNMDTPLATGGDTQVRYLRYADAEKIADKLKGQATATAKAQGGPPAAGAAGGGGGGTANVDSSVTIWADVATNALIITAPPKIMKSLMNVIDKLDIRRAQVQVEAIIVEVDVNKSSNIGVQWLLDGGNNYGYGVTNLPGSGTSIVDLAAAVLGVSQGTATSAVTTGTAGTTTTSGLSSSTVGTGATFAIGKYNQNTGKGFAALIQALRSDGSSNIISTPSLITMNNEEAEVKVTQEIPLITGSYSSSTASVGGTTSPFTTIQREEVGTILKVTPHINEGNSVQLKIEQEDSSPGAKLTDSADISTNKRSIKTTVLIEDGGIIVLGGLMSDTVTESEDRVPGLGAIPLLGNLFKSRSGSRQKKNLLVFIRPKILRDADATESTSESKYNEVRQDQRTLNNGHITLLPGQKQPVVPPMPPGSGLPAPPPSGANAQGATPNMPPPSEPAPQTTPVPTPAPAPSNPPPNP
ncbi:MAG TPA: type II secretion system secretin GspD [Steroidobacteraceae bacterium]|jgi:general secretion pathway protein D